MPRAYSTNAAATALGVRPKWLDNLLSHNSLDGVADGRQGVARRIAPSTVTLLYSVIALMQSLKTPAGSAIALARILEEDGEVTVAPGIKLSADSAAIQHFVEQRLLDAVQYAPQRKRGRPPKPKEPPASNAERP